jgi:23S rRNA (guanosine2251-2'-O)-methyltransferase
MLVYGVNAVIEALRAGRVKSLRVGGRTDARMSDVLALAASSHVKVERVAAGDLDRYARGGAHQGVVAEVESRASYDVADLVAESIGPPLLVVLDGIEDPQNLGAIVRTVDAAGAGGVVRQTRHAAPLGGATAKASAVPFLTSKLLRW